MHQTRQPRRHAQLSDGAQLILWGIRRWSKAAKHQHCIHHALTPRFGAWGCEDVVPHLDESMTLLAIGAKQPLSVHCPCHTQLTADEHLILTIWRALQTNRWQQALDQASELLVGRVNHAYCRCVALAAHQLLNQNLPFETKPQLRIVK